ncbi:SH3 domain-containing protein [bacterium]|nr:SH3 domain-containing protein [bacterium]
MTPLDTWIQVQVEKLNVRSGPGMDYERIGQIWCGEKFQVFERREDWRRIELKDGQTGWVHRDYIQPQVALRLD